MSEDAAAEPTRPLFTMVRGGPTPEQLAALIAVVSRRAGTVNAGPAPAPLWGRPPLRQPLRSGPDAWRISSLPS